MPRPKKSKEVVVTQDNVSEVIESTKKALLPITVTLKLAGQDQIVDTDNVLEYFRQLQIDRLRIKSPARFTFEYNGKTFLKTLMIPQVKRFIGNDVYKIIVAKQINQNLGIKANLI